jgi:hypothetical protein
MEGTSEMDWDPPPQPLFPDHLYFIILTLIVIGENLTFKHL